jgi:hypothetical protein
VAGRFSGRKGRGSGPATKHRRCGPEASVGNHQAERRLDDRNQRGPGGASTGWNSRPMSSPAIVVSAIARRRFCVLVYSLGAAKPAPRSFAYASAATRSAATACSTASQPSRILIVPDASAPLKNDRYGQRVSLPSDPPEFDSHFLQTGLIGCTRKDGVYCALLLDAEVHLRTE